jgi:hypothetical protein
VGELLSSLAREGKGTPAGLADLQPHLEPFSFALNDVAGASSPDGAAGWEEVSDRYPRGSRQPAWAALFREGRYRLFRRGGKARLFLQGEGSPEALFRRERDVVRHPLLALLDGEGRERLSLEVYAFRNDYRRCSLLLSPVPWTAEVTRANLRARGGALPLGEIAAFLSRASLLEGAEVDDGGNLFLYGRPGPPPTLSGAAASLPDLAAVYRAVFHSGRNGPYVSLDRNEDNRLAKVNLGGLLEDTRVGSVVLEADKVFKTLATGLSSDGTREVEGDMARAVPGFRTGSERALEGEESGTAAVRYWFYPDRVRTVTDGSLCAVESARFVADAERTDRRGPLSRSQAETLAHLNRNYDAYARILPPLRELDTVARFMAVATWLAESGAARRADLSALLSVELPPFETPRTTRKIVAVLVGTTAARGGRTETAYRLFRPEGGLDRYPPTMSDLQFIEMTTGRAGSSRDPALFPPSLREARAAVEREAAAVAASEGEAKARAAARYEEALRKVREFRVDFRSVGSASGGVNLRPGAFAPPRKAEPASPLLARLRGSAVLRSSTRPAVRIAATPTLRGRAEKSLGESAPSPPARGRKGGSGTGKGSRGGKGTEPPRREPPTASAPAPIPGGRAGAPEEPPAPRPLPSRAAAPPAIAPGRSVPLAAKGRGEGIVMSSEGGAIVLRRAR